jgi:hypothetical protein
VDFYPNVIAWPRLLNRDQQWSWELAGRTLSGGKAISTLEPKARIDGGGKWAATLENVRALEPDRIRAWRATVARLDGGATPFVMEMREPCIPPWPLDDSGDPISEQDEAAHSDDATFSDGSDYVSDVIRAEVKTAAALRATTLTLIIENAEALRGGEHFSLQHDTFSHRLYRIFKVVKIDDRPHTVQAVTFTGSPAVIAAIAHGLADAQPVFFRSTAAASGSPETTEPAALPGDLEPDTIYYAVPLTDDTFGVAATEDDAMSSPPVLVDVSGAEVGAHRVVAGGFATVTIRPPLREATAAGTRVEFDYPKCIMRLAEADTMTLNLDVRRFGTGSVKIEEDFPPFDLVEGDADE